METAKTVESIQTWLKGAKQDLHFLMVHLEEHGQKATKTKVAGNPTEAEYESSVVEMYYRRIVEMREVIGQEESSLSNLKPKGKPCECGCGGYPKSLEKGIPGTGFHAEKFSVTRRAIRRLLAPSS
jgi:hypothetical protein